MFKPIRKLSPEKKRKIVTALSDVCFVCGKKRGSHTRQQALQCDRDYPEAIKVK